MKIYFNNIIALKLILIVLISQVAIAQDISDDDFEDEFNEDDNFEIREEIRDEFKGDVFREEFKQEFRDIEKQEFRKEFRTEGMKFREEFREDRFKTRFEDLSKDEILFERVFEFLGDMDESELMPYCSDPEKIADIIISKVKDKIGDVSNVCKKIEEEEKDCEEEVKFHCTRFRQQDVDEAFDELEKLEILANSCPVDEEAIVKLCIFRSKEMMKQNLEFLEENCLYQWEDYGQHEQRNCELMLRDNICEKDKYIEHCLIRWGAYKCPEVSYPKGKCNGYWDQKYDNKGCIVSYFCVGEIVEEKTCPDVVIPECGENQYADDFYDEAGCRYYKCVDAKVSCPKIEIGHCVPGENLELQYDDNGCIVGYKCKSYTVCGDKTCNADFETPETCPEDCGIKCSYTKEEAERISNECLNNNGAPEKVYEDNCIVDVKCTIETTGNLSAITGNVIGITGRQVLETYEDYLDQCKKEWDRQKANCEQLPEGCGKEHFIDSCIKREEKNYERELSRVERRCEIDSKQHVRFMKRECSRSEEEVDRCVEENTRRCEQMEGISKECSEKLTEENFRKFIVKEAKKRCKYADRFLREGIYTGSVPKKVIEKILSLKEAGVPGEFRGILDEEADGLLDVSESLEDLGEKEEQKGVGYKIRLFLGFAKEIEEDEISRLELSKKRLGISISSLSKLAEQVPDDIAAEILKEQVADLERQKEDIDSLIEQKIKKSKGLLRLFGLFE